MSEATIYADAVEPKCNSTSSEDDMILELSDKSINNSNMCHMFADTARPGMSRQQEHDQREVPEAVIQQPSPEEETHRIIKEAEASKAKIFPPVGKPTDSNFEFIALMDQDYSLVGNHLDDQTCQKIIRGDYVDFCRLLPKERISHEDKGSKMELVIKNGKTFWSLVSDSVAITSFGRWEQAFRIYSNIYTKAHPQKSTQLIQYNHVTLGTMCMLTIENSDFT